MSALPCPHCGRAPSIQHIEAHEHHMMVNGYPMPPSPPTWFLECVCGSGMVSHYSECELLARWNRRDAQSEGKPE